MYFYGRCAVTLLLSTLLDFRDKMDNLKSLTLLVFVVFLNLLYYPVCGISGAFYADNGRGQSVLYQTLAKKDKSELRDEILNLLGLERRPRGRTFSKPRRNDFRKSSAEKYSLDLYKALGDADARAKFCRRNLVCLNLMADSDFIISFTNKIHQYTDLLHESDRRFFFDASKIPLESEIVNAELRLFRNVTNKSHLHKKSRYILSLYAVSEDNSNANILELVDELIITNADTRVWLSFNVTTAVMKWTAFPTKNLGLYLKIKTMVKYHGEARTASPFEVGVLTTKTPDEYKTFMVAYFKTTSQMHIRTRRATKKNQLASYYARGGFNPYRAPQDRYVPKVRSCERWALYVSFRDLGFEDWIIAPDGYAAFYCDGSCTFPLNAQMNATNHAIVQTLMHLMDPTSVPKPSCAPTQLTSITVLYFDDNSNVILKKYKNMVVKSCGCH